MEINKIYNEDCLGTMARMNDCEIDLVVTSPPYDNLRTYTGESEWDFNLFKRIANELYRVVTEGGVVVWVVSDATIKGSETGTSFKQALYFKEIGFNLHDTMIWSKPTFTATGALKVRYAQTFEYMFILSKGLPKSFNPIKDRENKTFGKTNHGSFRCPDGSIKRSSGYGSKTNQYGQRFNIWEMSGCNSSSERCGHPAPFPIQLAYDHIRSWSNENDLVYDPFMGSGTTAIASIRLNRNFIGSEISAEYSEIANNRINLEIQKLIL